MSKSPGPECCNQLNKNKSVYIYSEKEEIKNSIAVVVGDHLKSCQIHVDNTNYVYLT